MIESHGKKYVLPRNMRMAMKDFFCLERCIYCLDKLNIFADISFGDNYSEVLFSANEIYKSQHVDAREKNFIFGEYKSAQVGYPINNVPPEISCGVYEHPPIRREYESLLAKQKMGREKFFPQVAAELWKVTG